MGSDGEEATVVGLGSAELVVVLLVIALLVSVGAVVVLGIRSRDRTDIADLDILALVADRSSGHPACPGCGSLSFHPVPARHQSVFGLLLGWFLIASVYAGTPSGIVACTICGRRFRQR